MVFKLRETADNHCADASGASDEYRESAAGRGIILLREPKALQEGASLLLCLYGHV